MDNTNCGGVIMQSKTDILCNVNSCVYHKENHCGAETITVCCDNCIKPHESCETQCRSFKCNNSK